jgi:toxin-antitoxin system PIN domain toxin
LILIDANLLLYAYDPRSPFYGDARRWLAEAFSYEEEIGIPFQAILAFLRVSTNPNSARTPSAMAVALATVDSWLALANVELSTPGPKHWEIFKTLCLAAGVTGNVSTDVHIAALAIEYDSTLCSTDRDFARFPGLRWRNPLAA